MKLFLCLRGGMFGAGHRSPHPVQIKSLLAHTLVVVDALLGDLSDPTTPP
jgi:hypothetical protein